MPDPATILVLALALQVPAPPGLEASEGALRAEFRVITQNEARALDELAARSGGEAPAIRALIAPEPAPDGPWRFVPLPEVAPAPAAGLASISPPLAEARQARADAAREFFALAGKAAGQSRFGLAAECLRAVLERDPDHREARRLLGFVRFEGGWATAHAARERKAGRVLDPSFGWVPTSWVDHLRNGELPGLLAPGRPVPWLPAEEADALRADFTRRPWEITTEHFQIRTNVPLAEAIAFGRQLEVVREVFLTLMADLIDPRDLPLAQRFAADDLWARPTGKKHQVYYFAERADYMQFFRDHFRRDESTSLGYYMPPSEAAAYRVPPRCYFYRDAGGELDGAPTLFHEASHQLLFELAGRSNYMRNIGHYWIWEGLGTYFETLTPRPDGSYEIGDRIGPRMAKARQDLANPQLYTPIAELTTMGEARFREPSRVGTHYAQAMALVVFLMHADGAKYRAAFLSYVRDAYLGRFRAGGGAPDLPTRLGRPAEEIDEDFRRFVAGK